MRDNRELTPLAAEVTLCQQYLDLEKLRLGERLVVDWNVKSMERKGIEIGRAVKTARARRRLLDSRARF